MKLWKRFCHIFQRAPFHQELEEEMRLHMNLRAAELREQGIPDSENAALRAFGNPTRMREAAGELWTFGWLEDLARDVRHAIRILARTPGQTVVIVLLLALGIGANAGVFSIANPLFVRDLAVERPEELFAAGRPRREGLPISGTAWSTPLYEELRSRLQSADIAAAGGDSSPATGLTPGATFDDLNVTMVSGNYFDVLGIGAQVGRVFGEDDDRIADPNQVFVLSHLAWQRMLGGDRDAVGRNYDLAGSSFALIGVTPSDFTGLGGDLWVPLSTLPIINPGSDSLTNQNSSWMSVIGRPSAGVPFARVQAEGAVIWNRLADEYGLGETAGFVLRPLGRGFERLRGQYGAPLQIMMVTVGLLLLIACTNVASLLLAQAVARKREIAIRQALGCGASRLVRQFLVESSILAVLGGGLGLLVGLVGTRALVLFVAPAEFSVLNLALDQNVILFTFGAAVLSAILFGMAPAHQAMRLAIEPELRNASRNTSPSRRRFTLNRAAVVIQTALSVVLVAGAVFFARSLYEIYRFDPGFDWQGVITASVNSRAMGYDDFVDDRHAALADRIVERLSGLPSVMSVSATGAGFLTGTAQQLPMLIEGYTPEVVAVQTDPEAVGARVSTASNGFLETLGVPILSGRGFSNEDRPDGPRVAVVNDTFARAYFSGGSAIGKRLWPGTLALNESGELDIEFNRDEPVEIVGIAADSKYLNFREEAVALAFFPLGQQPYAFSHVQIRAEGDLSTLLSPVREAILEVDPRLNPTRIETARQSLDRVVARDILLARLSGIFGGLGLILMGFGIYGLISYTVAQRTSEIGIRLALGARPGALLRGVVLDALKTLLPGLMIGIAVATLAAQYAESLFFGVTAGDSPTYLMVAASLLLTGILGAYIPARRASRTDPMVTLSFE